MTTGSALLLSIRATSGFSNLGRSLLGTYARPGLKPTVDGISMREWSQSQGENVFVAACPAARWSALPSSGYLRTSRPAECRSSLSTRSTD